MRLAAFAKSEPGLDAIVGSQQMQLGREAMTGAVPRFPSLVNELL